MIKAIRSFAALTALLLLLTAVPAAQAAAFYQLGDKVDDFTVTTWDGQTVSLYGLLEEHDAVLINVWATWCGPCRQEFPAMQQAYEVYGDDVAILAIDSEPTDTNEELAAYVQSMGLTFPTALDTANVQWNFGVTAFPTSIIIDRFGTVCYMHAGSMPDAALFAQLFEAFIGDDYTESRIFSSLPPKRPDITPAGDEQLAAVKPRRPNGY